MTRRIALAVSVATLILQAAMTASCTSGCPYRLATRLGFSSDPKFSGDQPTSLGCCGAFRFQNVDLRAPDIQEVDLANRQANSGHIDAFLTSPDCERLFDGTYEGAASSPLCRIYIGPVTGGTVSGRQTLPKGMYRMFVQAWSSNELSNIFGIDVGLYTDECRPNFMAP